jgi:hypothetical protein
MLVLTRLILLVVLWFACAGSGLCDPTCSPSAAVRFAYPRADLDDVLRLYSQLSGRPVYVDAGVGGTIDVMSQNDIPGSEALAWIRRQLLDRCGIEVHDAPSSDIRVSWSADHDQVREATKRSLKTVPDARVIDIATLDAKKPH